ncbi:MAG: polysaccharide pyruvyl transferase family protein [Anaerolineaceae bacterium]|nr:polysaccharide pyruvyl transferase family protein [Anaerolineaceae bacterium]
MKKGHIVIAGETYSTNLGDGVIFDALKYLFKQVDPSAIVVPLDITGRKNPQMNCTQTPDRKKMSMIRFGEKYLGSVYSILAGAAQYLVVRRRANRQWKPVLEGASALVIGGGQLLMDNHLGFPVKIMGIASAAESLGIPIHLCACGVGEYWSRIARWIFRSVLSGATTVSLRDSLSKARLDSFIPGVSSTVTFDPAIWTDEVYGWEKPQLQKQLIGVGVINYLDAKLRFSKKVQISEGQWIDMWFAIMQRLHYRKIPFEIFTNGSPADHEFAAKLSHYALQWDDAQCSLAERPLTPADLAHTISRYSGVIAARLHANIIANSYSVPSVGIIWDEKVRSYFQHMKRGEYCFDLENLDPEILVEKLTYALQQGMDRYFIERAKEKALLSAQIVLEYA